MKRKAFLLTEQLTTILLQAGFILVLVTAFYLVLNFYTKTQQVLTARNRAERVIQFVDDKIRHTGLGLWRCNEASLRTRLKHIPMLSGYSHYAYNLPVSIADNDGTMNEEFVPEESDTQTKGNVLTLLYAEGLMPNPDALTSAELKELLENKFEIIPLIPESAAFTWDGTESSAVAKIIDTKEDNQKNLKYIRLSFAFDKLKANINNYAVMVSLGLPIYLHKLSGNDLTAGLFSSEAETVTIPAASELLALRCLQMYVRSDGDKRQLVWRELTDNGNKWMEVGKKVNNSEYGLQEDDILEIYAKLDSTTNILTLYVLASGGTNDASDTPRPDAWPKEAEPKGSTDEDARTAWLKSDYKNHVVYVTRKSWKLNTLK